MTGLATLPTVRAWTGGIDDIDLSDAAFWRRPMAEREAAFALLRARRPVARFADPTFTSTSITFPPGRGYLAVTRHADVAHVSRHPEVFLSGPGAVSQLDLPAEMVEYFSGMISTDNPRHARLRRIVSTAFSPRQVRVIEQGIQNRATRLVGRARDAGSGDFVADIAAPLPLEVIADMMGVPASEHETIARCSDVIVAAGDPAIVPEGHDPVVALLEAGATLRALMEDLGRYRRQHPVDDITSALVNATIESERLSDQELASFFILLVIAGNETTRSAIAHALVALSEHPDQRQRLLDDVGGLMGTATDEIVRWASPVIWMRRTLAVPATLSGVELAAGDKVLLIYQSANRDETAFDHPEAFDVGRRPNDHFGFGAPGPHFCLGAHLARREIAVTLETLLAQAPQVRATADPVRVVSNFVNGIAHLPYAWA